jgi:hypothetical protein
LPNLLACDPELGELYVRVFPIIIFRRRFLPTRPVFYALLVPTFKRRWRLFRLTKFTATNVLSDVAIDVLATIENAPVNANVGTTASLGAIALQLARRAPKKCGRFALREEIGLGHVRVTLLPLVAAAGANLGMVAVVVCHGLLLDTTSPLFSTPSPLFSPPADKRTPLPDAAPVQFVYQFNDVNVFSTYKIKTFARDPCKRTHFAAGVTVARGERGLGAGRFKPGGLEVHDEISLWFSLGNVLADGSRAQ